MNKKIKEFRQSLIDLDKLASVILMEYKNEDFYDEMEQLFCKGFQYIMDAICYLPEDEGDMG